MARAAARASADDVARWLFDALKANEVTEIFSADDLLLFPAGERGDAPQIIWESGPFEWAYCITGGESLTSEEGFGRGPRGEKFDEIFDRAKREGFYFECVNSYSLAVYPT